MKTPEEFLKAKFPWIEDGEMSATTEVMREYAREACKEQRHICQIERDKNTMQDENGRWYVSCADVLDADLPEGLELCSQKN